jgi:hypothetical protein
LADSGISKASIFVLVFKYYRITSPDLLPYSMSPPMEAAVPDSAPAPSNIIAAIIISEINCPKSSPLSSRS